MPKVPSPGILVAFDGIDGAGKTTQVNLLAEALRRLGEDVVTSKEPTNGAWGRKIRESAVTGRLPLEEEIEAFVQDRQEHVQSLIQPSLDEGRTVILDRYFYSTIAYQGSRGADIEDLDRRMREMAPTPDVAYILDLEPAEAIARIHRRDGGPNEFERLDYLLKVRDVFKKLWEIDEDLWEVEASLSADIIQSQIFMHLFHGVLKEKRCAKSYACEDPFHCLPRMGGECEWWNFKASLSNYVRPLVANAPRRLAFSLHI